MLKHLKNLLFWSSAVLLGIFWPVSFLRANPDGQTYVLALLVCFFSWFLYLRGNRHYYFLYLLLPLIHPAYLPFPPIIFILHFLSSSSRQKWRDLTLIIYLSLCIFISIFSIKSFYSYSIFTPDPLAFDTLNKKISLIPSRNLARIFHNKTDLYQDKFKANIFSSLDPNNYFFSLHPREIFESQNLAKFSFVSLIPFLVGLFYWPSYKHKKWLLLVFLVSLFSLALINNQDKFDLILYLPIFLICFYGLEKIFSLSQKYYLLFSVIFLGVSSVELIRLLLS